MGFLAFGGTQAPQPQRMQASVGLLHRLGCKVCPLNTVACNKHPHMEPTGSREPVIYMLGEAPGEVEDRQDTQFVGPSGEVLRARIPRDWARHLRWNNVVRTRPPDNRDPTFTEIEACRPSVVADIEASKPRAIFGFGAIALEWVCGEQGITRWRGRRMPVRVGKHACWYYPMLHPSYLLHLRREQNRGPSYIGSEMERAFVFDMERALNEVERLPAADPHDGKRAFENVTWVEGADGDLRRVARELEWYARQSAVGVDYETKGLRPYTGKVLTAAVATPDKAFVFPFDHPQAKWSKPDRQALQGLWVVFLRAKRVRKVSHNLPFEQEWTAWHFDDAVLWESGWEDTMTQASILDERIEGKPGCMSLDFLTQQYFGINLKSLMSLDMNNLDREPLAEVLRYNGPDAKYHAALYQQQAARLKAEGLQHVYEHTVARVPTVVLTQLNGVPVNQVVVRELYDKYEERVRRLAAELESTDEVRAFRKRRGEAFVPSKPEHVEYVLRKILNSNAGFYDAFGSPTGRSYSTDKDVLKRAGGRFCELEIEWREAAKRKSTYIDKYMAGVPGSFIYPDGMLHPRINVNRTTTGRSSSEEPNEQNVPKRDEEAKEVRRQMDAGPGHKFRAFDYGQIQGRIIAMASKDREYIKALWERYDIHGDEARHLAWAWPERVGGKSGIKDAAVMDHFRGDVKNQWTFPLFFGARLESVADYLKMPKEKIAPEYERFWCRFAGVRQWQERLLKRYRDKGYVEALSGRRRRAPLSPNKIFNSPVQADEAFVVFNAANRISRDAMFEDKPWRQPCMLIHDDLTFRSPDKGADADVEWIVDRMLDLTGMDFINVPISIEMLVGQDWENMKKVETFWSDKWKA